MDQQVFLVSDTSIYSVLLQRADVVMHLGRAQPGVAADNGEHRLVPEVECRVTAGHRCSKIEMSFSVTVEGEIS